MNFLCMLNTDLDNLEAVRDYYHINMTIDIEPNFRERLNALPFVGSLPGSIAVDGPGKPPASLEDISFYIDGLGTVTQTNGRFGEIGIRLYPEALKKLKEIGKVHNGRLVVRFSLNLEEQATGTDGLSLLVASTVTVSKDGQDASDGKEPIQVDLG